MKVLLINGSPRAEGNTYYALRECATEIEKYGIETEIFNIGAKPIRGCIACGACDGKEKCVFEDDALGKLLPKMKEADGYIVGTPVYYAGPNGALCALLDRAFYSSSRAFSKKPAAAIAICRRGGASAALDRLNKYFTINQMPVVSSQYWNIAHGMNLGEVLQDAEGMQTMRTLGKNMAHTLKNLLPQDYPELGEQRSWTNFVR